MGKGTLGKKSRMDLDEMLYRKAHATVLQQSSLVAPYREEHKSILQASNRGKTEQWIARHHVDTFRTWLRRKLMGDNTIDEQIQWLARSPSITVLTFQAYEINGYTFYHSTREPKTKRARTKTAVSL